MKCTRRLKSGSSTRKCLPQLRKASTRWSSSRSFSMVVLPCTRRMVCPRNGVTCSLRMTMEGPSCMSLICSTDSSPRPLCNPMQTIQLGQSDLRVTPICLGTMTFGEQVNEQDAHAILDRAVARGINFLDTAEMYSVPPRPETFGTTETILGRWFAARPGLRQKVVLASKVAGPSRGMPWVRNNEGLAGADIIASCEVSLKRLQTEVIDLYQIHWPERHVPTFGEIYYRPERETSKT